MEQSSKGICKVKDVPQPKSHDMFTLKTNKHRGLRFSKGIGQIRKASRKRIASLCMTAVEEARKQPRDRLLLQCRTGR